MKWAPNPFALAERILDKPLGSTDWGTATAYLGEAFSVEPRQLLDKIGDQWPLLYALEDIADAVTTPKRLEELLQLPAVKRAKELFKLSDDALRRVLPYLVPVVDAKFGPPPGDGGGGPAPASAVTYHAAGPIITGDVSYLDPKQGSIADCYLVSSMISLAWAAQDKWSNRIHNAWHETPNRRMEIAFCETAAKLFPAVTVTGFLPNDANGSVYTIGRDGTEAWPGMIEKAFVVQERPSLAEPTFADFQFIATNGMDPQDACAMLVAGTKHVSGVESEDPPRRSTAVRDLCDGHGVTKVPTMAWTFPREDQTGGFDLAPQLQLATTGLRRNHAYAVLGTLQGTSVAGVAGNFIVLRNPWGTAPLPAVYATGTWSKNDNGREDVVLNSDGVFAVAESVFDDCFSNVGWVEPK